MENSALGAGQHLEARTTGATLLQQGSVWKPTSTMSNNLKPGERVRVTCSNTLPIYLLGTTGTVKQGPYPAPHGGHYYIVQMDNDTGGGPAIYMAEELEIAD
jgi:hypothetical protein